MPEASDAPGAGVTESSELLHVQLTLLPHRTSLSLLLAGYTEVKH